jgi:hypothetical protein
MNQPINQVMSNKPKQNANRMIGISSQGKRSVGVKKGSSSSRGVGVKPSSHK